MNNEFRTVDQMLKTCKFCKKRTAFLGICQPQGIKVPADQPFCDKGESIFPDDQRKDIEIANLEERIKELEFLVKDREYTIRELKTKGKCRKCGKELPESQMVICANCIGPLKGLHTTKPSLKENLDDR